MMTIQKQRVLFFYQGDQPSAEAKVEARAIGMVFRDADAYRSGDFLEHCDAVAGTPPKAYADAFPAYEPPADSDKPAKQKADSRGKKSADPVPPADMPAEQGDAPPAADGE